MDNALLLLVRWTPRLIGIPLVGLVAVIAFAERGSLIRLSLGDMARVAGLFAACIGLVLSWRWEAIGAWLTVGSMGAFYLANFALSGRFPGGWVFPLILASGVMSLMSVFLHSSQKGTLGP